MTLMSRRMHHNTGTRYNARGINDKGYVGNQCETEQILTVDNRYLISHVQIRGSVPVFWAQQGMMEDVCLTRNPEMTKKAFGLHFKEILDTYGPVYCINLLRFKTPREVLITTEYVRHVYESEMKKDIQFLNFDFHHYCGGDKYEALKVLVQKINDGIVAHDYLVENISSKTVERL